VKETKAWMLYGANGYTGSLIAEEAKHRGMSPILAGRREEAVHPIAERLGMNYRIFSLDSPETIAKELENVSAVLLTAGPFSGTSSPVVEACLRTGTHYLDITGEIAVFEACRARDDEAKKRGCVILPGVGLDVVPTDCLAASLKAALPDAEFLEMAIAGMGSFSRGTMKTMLEGISQGGAIRENGRIRRVPLAWKTATIPFRDHSRNCVTIPWGDISTAYFSTGIPNIVFYMSTRKSWVRGMRIVRNIAPLLGTGFVQRRMKAYVDRGAAGPSDEIRKKGRAQIWGRATNKEGRVREGTLVTPEGYQLTILTSLESVSRVIAGKVQPGYHTPSTAFGPGFITEFPSCDLRIT